MIKIARPATFAFAVIACLASRPATAETPITLLHSFSGPDGNSPSDGLVLDSTQTLYGETLGGPGGNGAIFSVKVDGTGFALLHSFDEGGPRYAPLVLGPDGSLYGSTPTGGSAGGGTIFKLNTAGTEFTLLHSFALGSSEASSPIGAISFDADGNLFGTAYFGGANNAGTIFTCKTDGSEFRILYSLTAAAADSSQGVILDGDGNIYGATLRGGNAGCAGGCGTLFTLKTDGTGFSILYSFSATGPDGIGPKAGGLLVANGVLYGITTAGGSIGIGSVFSIKTDGTKFTTLHSFSDPYVLYPMGPLVLDSAGFLYGTTEGGGANALGTVFRVKTDGSGFATLHSFSLALTDGAIPSAGLAIDSDGNIYGSTSEGGSSESCRGTMIPPFDGCGAVFKLSQSPRAGISLTTLPGPAETGQVTGRSEK